MILLVHSDAFRAMLDGEKFLEEKTNILKLEDMTEDAVRALLKFLYYRDIKGPSGNMSIALELLTCADKYGITFLEDEMWSILGARPDEEFDVSIALRLFFFASRFGFFKKDFQTKAVEILKE